MFKIHGLRKRNERKVTMRMGECETKIDFVLIAKKKTDGFYKM